jgi:large subunit ribosomal protein L22
MADNDKVQFQNLKNKQSKTQNKVEKKEKIVKPLKKEVAEKKENEEKQSIEEKIIESNSEKVAEKKEIAKKKVENKHYAQVFGRNLRISLKHSKGIGRFIKYKKIERAINDLELVIKKKIAVPMVGELPHRKGKGMMSGRYPINASKEFIKLLKNLNANSSVNGLELENVRVVEVIANKAPDQMHRGGRTKFKRTHVQIKSSDLGRNKK